MAAMSSSIPPSIVTPPVSTSTVHSRGRLHPHHSRGNSMSSSSVVTIVSRGRSPDAPDGPRPATSPLLAVHQAASRPQEATSLSVRNATAADPPRRSSLILSNRDSAGPLKRWSQSSASSSVSSTGHRKGRLSARLSFRASTSLGSYRHLPESQSPPRPVQLTARSAGRSPQRRRSLSVSSSSKPSPTLAAGQAAVPDEAPSLTLRSLSKVVDDDSSATSLSASGTPLITELRNPAGSDYFGQQWLDRPSQKPSRPVVQRTSTAPVGAVTASYPRTFPPPHPLRPGPRPSLGPVTASEAPRTRRAPRASSRDTAGAAKDGASSDPAQAQQASRRRRKDRERDRPDRHPSQKAMLSKALQKANTAVLLDNAQNYEGAMEAYSHACTLLQQVMKRSSGDEFHRKLDAIRQTYTARIAELQTMPLQDRNEGKALPARPNSDKLDRDSTSLSIPSSGGDEGRGSTDDSFDLEPGPSRTIAPALVPARRESLRPAASNGPIARPKRSSSSVPPTAQLRLETPSHLAIPMDREYMPPPLSPRRPLSPAVQPSNPTQAAAEHTNGFGPADGASDGQWSQQLAIDGQQRERADSTETTSWLNTIDESGGSTASSVHSRSSSLHLRRKRIRAASGATEAEFDAALDAAVEAAYDDGFEVASEEDRFAPDLVSSVRRNVERAKERVREAEREAAIEFAKERHKSRIQDNAFRHRLPDALGLEYGEEEAEEEERMLEEMTRGYVDDSEFGLQSKSALPRESDSSGFSHRTWASSSGSNPTTAATSLQTLAEVHGQPAWSSQPSQAAAANASTSAAPMIAPLTPTTPTMNGSANPGRSAPTPEPPSPKTLQPSSVRTRRLSARLSGQNQNPKPLKIETSKALAHSTRGPLTEPELPSQSPSAAVEGGALRVGPGRAATGGPMTSQMIAGSLMRAQTTAMSQDTTRHVSSPVTGPSPGDGGASALPLTPALSKTLSTESEGSLPPMPQSGSPSRWNGRGSKTTDYLRKIHSSSSLRSRRFDMSSPDESDPSPSTPVSTTFGHAEKAASKPSVPALPTTMTANFVASGLPSGGLYLFDHEIHAPQTPGSPNPLVSHAPAQLESCPTDTVLRPFWLMRCMYQTLAHPRGGYLSTRLFVPADVWRVKGVKLKSIDEKVTCCDFLTAALLKLGKVDTCDADAVLEEMQALEVVLDQVQTTLGKKLGNEVGIQGSSALLKEVNASGEAGNGENGTSKATSGASKATSYLSWKRLRSKNSGAALTMAFTGLKEMNKDKEAPSVPSLPMTETPSTRPPKRDSTQLNFTGPNATYRNALARLFDAAQTLDAIARQVEDPGLKHSSPTHVGIELSTRHAAEFFGFYVCRFALADMGTMLDKFIKRGSEWVVV